MTGCQCVGRSHMHENGEMESTTSTSGTVKGSEGGDFVAKDSQSRSKQASLS